MTETTSSAIGTKNSVTPKILSATAELRFQLRERIGLVAFADYGQVWTDNAFGGEADDHAGAGLGLRYDTPIGPLRFDVAGPVSGESAYGWLTPGTGSRSARPSKGGRGSKASQSAVQTTALLTRPVRKGRLKGGKRL